jgi:tRNA threonylcarbamoyladenosine biosynthesis protein TsaE
VAGALARELRPGAWVLLEGPMGAGKSTFARALLSSLGFRLPPEGSPTFAIAHEYEEAGIPRTVHIDLYRIEDEEELEAAGIHAMFWDSPESIILSEWASNWPSLESALLEDPRHDRWRVRLEFQEQDPLKRSVRIERIS